MKSRVLIGRRGFRGGGGGGRGFRGGGATTTRTPRYPYPHDPYAYYENDDSELDDHDEVVSAGLRGNELLALLPIIALGRRGLSFNLDLGQDLQLRARVCIDGKCYESTRDMTAVLASILGSVTEEHESTNGTPASSSPEAASEVSDRTDAAVQSAGMELVGAMCSDHEVSAGWWDKLQKTARTFSLSHQIASIPAVARTLQQNKGAITQAASTVASAYYGPAGGAMAKAFTGPIIDDLTVDKNNPGASAHASKAVAQAHEAAKSDSETARALQAAHQAVADTAVAYHLAATAGKAASGDQTSASKIAELEAAAHSGDPAAAQAMQVVAETLRSRRPAEDRTESAGTHRARGQVHKRKLALRAEGMAAAQALLDETGARIIGYARTRSSGQHAGQHGSVVTLSDTTFVAPFGSTKEAAQFVADSERAGDVVYAAFYSVDDLMWPGPVVEVFGGSLPRG
jgi:hypothetical protein